jgi:hypothetical protein
MQAPQQHSARNKQEVTRSSDFAAERKAFHQALTECDLQQLIPEELKSK